jgi:hypothetical protein
VHTRWLLVGSIPQETNLSLCLLSSEEASMAGKSLKCNDPLVFSIDGGDFKAFQLFHGRRQRATPAAI